MRDFIPHRAFLILWWAKLLDVNPNLEVEHILAGGSRPHPAYQFVKRGGHQQDSTLEEDRDPNMGDSEWINFFHMYSKYITSRFSLEDTVTEAFNPMLDNPLWVLIKDAFDLIKVSKDVKALEVARELIFKGEMDNFQHIYVWMLSESFKEHTLLQEYLNPLHIGYYQWWAMLSNTATPPPPKISLKRGLWWGVLSDNLVLL